MNEKDMDAYRACLTELVEAVVSGRPADPETATTAHQIAAKAAIQADPQTPGACWTSELEQLGDALDQAGLIQGWPWKPAKYQVLDLLRKVIHTDTEWTGDPEWTVEEAE
jgi:hypothetical protein